MGATVCPILVDLYYFPYVYYYSRTPVTRDNCSKRTEWRRKSGPEESSPFNDRLRSGAGRARKILSSGTRTIFKLHDGAGSTVFVTTE